MQHKRYLANSFYKKQGGLSLWPPTHELKALLQVIVGLDEGSEGLWVGVHNEKKVCQLKVIENPIASAHSSKC